MTTMPDVTTPTVSDTFDPTAYPYNSVVRITATIGGNRFQSTGVLISPDEVLTADHVSYKSGADNGVATAIDIATATLAGTGPVDEYIGTVAHYFPVINDPAISFADLQTDYSIIHLSKPVIDGNVMNVTPDFAGGNVHVTGFPAASGDKMVDDVQTVTTDPSYSIYDGTAIGAGSSGAPVWLYGADGRANVVGVVSSATDSTAYDMQITAAQATQIAAWVAADDAVLSTAAPPDTASAAPAPDAPPPAASPITPSVAVPPTAPPTVTPPVSPPLPAPVAAPPVSIADGKTGQVIADTLSKAYTGPVAGLATEFIDITPQNLNVTANTPGLFIHTGGGDDAVALNSGTNVVDGGAGSNFLTAGTGFDTFFVDARKVAADVWSTISKFHGGDAATVWGISPSTAMQWVDGAGAPGFTGLPLHAASAGGPTASLTLAGFSRADMASGTISTSFGHDAASGSDYLYVHGA